MDYVRDLEKRFVAEFAKHRILEQTASRIYMANPSCNYLWTEFVRLREGKLLVHGDFDACIFGRAPTQTSLLYRIAWITGNVFYISSKVEVPRGSQREEWNAEVARQNLRDCAADALEEGDREREASVFLEALNVVDDGHGAVVDVLEAGGVDDVYEYSIGQVPLRRVLLARAACLVCDRLLSQ